MLPLLRAARLLPVCGRPLWTRVPAGLACRARGDRDDDDLGVGRIVRRPPAQRAHPCAAAGAERREEAGREERRVMVGTAALVLGAIRCIEQLQLDTSLSRVAPSPALAVALGPVAGVRRAGLHVYICVVYLILIDVSPERIEHAGCRRVALSGSGGIARAAAARAGRGARGRLSRACLSCTVICAKLPPTS